MVRVDEDSTPVCFVGFITAKAFGTGKECGALFGLYRLIYYDTICSYEVYYVLVIKSFEIPDAGHAFYTFILRLPVILLSCKT